jgi:hypothetical protein
MNHMSMSILKFKAVETCGAPLPFKGAANFAGNAGGLPVLPPLEFGKDAARKRTGLLLVRCPAPPQPIRARWWRR